MKTVTGRRISASVQVALKKALQDMYRSMANDVMAVVVRYAGIDGKIDQREGEVIRREVRIVVESYFASPSPFADDGVTATAPYTRILNRMFVLATGKVIRAHANWMAKQVTPALATWLRRASIPADVQKKEVNLYLPLSPFQVTNALNDYDTMHRFVDPGGYRLSDRVWRTSDATRQAIDDLLITGIRQNKSAIELSKALEAYLVPTESGRRTLRPYGRKFGADGASYSGMRLARTEIARAHNQAAWLAAKLNTYVDRIDIARSGAGDASCKICPQHASIDMGGGRVRDPYDKFDAPIPPFHPHDMCLVLQVVVDNPSFVTDELTVMMERGDSPPLTPMAGYPAAGDVLIYWSVGAALWSLWTAEEAA